MKRLLFILSFIAIAATSFAQLDTVSVSLTAKQHSFIVAYLPDKGQVERSKYIFTILPQIDIVKDTTGKNVLKYPDKLVKYVAPVSLLEDIFLQIGSQQERLVASDNRSIQESLMSQLTARKRFDVLQRIGELVKRNAAQNDEVVQKNGIDYITELKP